MYSSEDPQEKKRVYETNAGVVLCINGAAQMVLCIPSISITSYNCNHFFITMSNSLIIREYDAETDFKTVEKLEKNCTVGSKMNVSIFSDMTGDPLCRIRFYPVHVMLVAKMANHGELVGVVRGCTKKVGFGLKRSHLTMGYILGLRISPRHRRMGIGLNLMKAVEEWLTKNGAEYVYLAAEENNIASRNMVTLKCHYKISSSLQIYVRPADNDFEKLIRNINIEKLQVNQAVSFYKNQLKCKDLYPEDIETILRSNPSLGTWVCYFNDEVWEGLHVSEDHNTETVISTKPSSWMIFSIWNSREVYKLQIQKSNHYLQYFLCEALSHAREVIFPCIKPPLVHGSFLKPFGFLFLYGILGEGNRLRELMKMVWNFAAKLAKDVDCKVVMTELGDSDPLQKHIPSGSSMLSIKDVWYFKNTDNCGNTEERTMGSLSGSLGNVFVDPRDF